MDTIVKGELKQRKGTKVETLLPKTSAVNEEQYRTHFKTLLKTHDAIIHITLSSEMSCAYSNAVKAAAQYNNVYVVDSRSLSTGIALLCIKASKMAEQGLPADEIVNKLKELTQKVQASFILDKLTYLVKGGRCNTLLAFGANILQIKPQIIVKDGKMVVGKKYMGKYDKNVKRYCVDTLSANPDVDKEFAFITYTTATKEQIDSAKDLLRQKGFINIFETTAGGTISSHCGPNTLGILFIKS